MRLKQSSWVWTVSKITILIKALWRNLQIFHANLMANFHTCAATPYNIQRPRARRGSKQKEKRKYFYDLFTRTTVYFSATIIYRRPSTYYCCVHCFFFVPSFFDLLSSPECAAIISRVLSPTYIFLGNVIRVVLILRRDLPQTVCHKTLSISTLIFTMISHKTRLNNWIKLVEFPAHIAQAAVITTLCF